ncbi:MAG: LamG domain-containing protein [bacterium]|nr:LamG domain-containing protein [bacterium]
MSEIKPSEYEMAYQDFIPESDWSKTPLTVKEYIIRLQTTIHRLRQELKSGRGRSSDSFSDALEFDGLSDYLVTPHPLDINANEFTFEARILAKSRCGEFKIIHMYGPEMVGKSNWLTLGRGRDIGWLSWQYSGIWWGLFGSNGVAKAIHSGHAKQGDVNPPMWYMEGEDSVSINEWHHVCGTWDSRELKLFVDGNLVNCTPFKEKVKLATSAYIGASYGGMSQFFPGKLNDVRIWNRGLSPEEVRVHSEGGMTEDEDNLVINYSTILQPVRIAESPSQDEHWDTDRILEIWECDGALSEEIEQLPSSIQILIQDLTEHLVKLRWD